MPTLTGRAEVGAGAVKLRRPLSPGWMKRGGLANGLAGSFSRLAYCAGEYFASTTGRITVGSCELSVERGDVSYANGRSSECVSSDWKSVVSSEPYWYPRLSRVG